MEFEVILEDINDNAPFLDMPDGLVWTENQRPGIVFWYEVIIFEITAKWIQDWSIFSSKFPKQYNILFAYSLFL